MTEFTPNIAYGDQAHERYAGFYLNLGAGAKYFIANRVTVDLMYTNFVAGVSSGAGQTFNFGISFLTGY